MFLPDVASQDKGRPQNQQEYKSELQSCTTKILTNIIDDKQIISYFGSL